MSHESQDVHQKKKMIREIMLSQRDALDFDQVAISSHIIIEKIKSLPEYTSCKQLFLYYPLNKEVNLLPLVEDAKNRGISIGFPKVLSRQKMEFYQINALNEFTLGKFNVMEPISNDIILPSQNTMILIPGLAFSINGHRIGFGAGYYDRFLGLYATDLSLLTVGVGYQWQILPSLPMEGHDKQLAAIISDDF